MVINEMILTENKRCVLLANLYLLMEYIKKLCGLGTEGFWKDIHAIERSINLLQLSVVLPSQDKRDLFPL